MQQQSIGTGYTRRRGQLEQDVREKVTRRMWGDGRDGCLVAGNERKELTVKSPTSETRSTLRLPAAFTSVSSQIQAQIGIKKGDIDHWSGFRIRSSLTPSCIAAEAAAMSSASRCQCATRSELVGLVELMIVKPVVETANAIPIICRVIGSSATVQRCDKFRRGRSITRCLKRRMGRDVQGGRVSLTVRPTYPVLLGFCSWSKRV